MESQAFGTRVYPKHLLIVCLLGLACAAGPRPQPETSARLKDSVPDKIAAQRAASGDLKLEDEADRWGIEAAQARKTKTDHPQQPPASTTSLPDGPVDLRYPPPDEPSE